MTIKTLIHIYNLLRADLSEKEAACEIRSAKRRAYDQEHEDETGAWLDKHNPYILEERVAIDLERESRDALAEFEAADWH